MNMTLRILLLTGAVAFTLGVTLRLIAAIATFGSTL